MDEKQDCHDRCSRLLTYLRSLDSDDRRVILVDRVHAEWDPYWRDPSRIYRLGEWTREDWSWMSPHLNAVMNQPGKVPKSHMSAIQVEYLMCVLVPNKFYSMARPGADGPTYFQLLRVSGGKEDSQSWNCSSSSPDVWSGAI